MEQPIRKPTRVFTSANDGYNLQTLYTSAKDFLDNLEDGGPELVDYYYSLILIHTSKGHKFGAFITAFPMHDRKTAKAFVGTAASFVFSFTKDEAL